ncbi:SIP domain-containing protein [Roseibium salinum]|nr:SIP domain-containing protein [Roseibium salinum]
MPGGIAVFEVPLREDIREITAPAAVEVHWLIQEDAHVPSTAQVDFVKALDWPAGIVQTCIAGESSVIRALRDYLHNELKVEKERHLYFRLLEDGHGGRRASEK